MKKTFPLSAPDRATARVIDAIKHDVRKYVKRERRKPLPEGTDFWNFACKVGPDAATAEPKVIDEVNAAIDAVAAGGARHEIGVGGGFRGGRGRRGSGSWAPCRHRKAARGQAATA